jgi:8-oxo-dGTP pyrophosphatase MutT (NUDIX family)
VSADCEITVLEDVRASFEERSWPWAHEHAGAIARLWDDARRTRPQMFDGEVLLAKAPRRNGPVLELRFFPVRFSAFFAFKEAGFPDESAVNVFAMAAVRCRDGRFLLGEMGAHTANPGQIYFPSGTPDRSDMTPGGAVDLAGSVLRELAEETGLEPAGDAVVGDWHMLHQPGQIALMRPISFPADSSDVLARVRGTLAAQTEPEFTAVSAWLPAAAAADPRLPGFMRAYLDWRAQGQDAEGDQPAG